MIIIEFDSNHCCRRGEADAGRGGGRGRGAPDHPVGRIGSLEADRGAGGGPGRDFCQPLGARSSRLRAAGNFPPSCTSCILFRRPCTSSPLPFSSPSTTTQESGATAITTSLFGPEAKEHVTSTTACKGKDPRRPPGPDSREPHNLQHTRQKTCQLILQAGNVENPWLSAMSSHFAYWASPDVALFILRALHHQDVRLGAVKPPPPPPPASPHTANPSADVPPPPVLVATASSPASRDPSEMGASPPFSPASQGSTPLGGRQKKGQLAPEEWW